MLIRFIVNNVLSFGVEREFNMLPNAGLKTLGHHKYKIQNFEVLKLASLYGANGAGKSNLISALDFLQELVTMEDMPIGMRNSQFRFQADPEDSKQSFEIEFLSEEIPFYYGVEIEKGIVVTEELYISGLGKKDDQLLFKRVSTDHKDHTITFLDEFERDPKGQVLKEVILEDFVKSHRSILKTLSNRGNPYLKDIKAAYNWLSNTLVILRPNSRPFALAEKIDRHGEFKKYAEEVMCAFNVGITSVGTSKVKAIDFFGRDMSTQIEDVIVKLNESNNRMAQLELANGRQVLLVNEDGETYVKHLQLEHRGKNDIAASFSLEEESDGTIRLLDFVPAFREIIKERKVFVIDEIERSIHPLLIRELLRKFSADENTLGQLVFTTHESNLLDQSIFRQDEIWFAEKDSDGITDLYSLSDFKEHKTIDIRKGYLNGRYGSVPFLGNLTELNWHAHDIQEPSI